MIFNNPKYNFDQNTAASIFWTAKNLHSDCTVTVVAWTKRFVTAMCGNPVKVLLN